MPTITGQPIITNYGEQQLVAGTFNVTKIKLGSGIWTPTEADTALNTQEADLAATGAVIAEGATGYRLHITGSDGSANVYDWHEFAITDNTDQALAIYSQAAIIASKASGTSLGVALDLKIESAPVGSISISGPTTYDLPQASTAIKGIIEIATDAEAAAGTDTTRGVTPKQLFSAAPRYAARLQFGLVPQVLWERSNSGSFTPNGNQIYLDFATPVVATASQGAVWHSNDTGNPVLQWAFGFSTDSRLVIEARDTSGSLVDLNAAGANSYQLHIGIVSI